MVLKVLVLHDYKSPSLCEKSVNCKKQTHIHSSLLFLISYYKHTHFLLSSYNKWHSNHNNSKHIMSCIGSPPLVGVWLMLLVCFLLKVTNNKQIATILLNNCVYCCYLLLFVLFVLLFNFLYNYIYFLGLRMEHL